MEGLNAQLAGLKIDGCLVDITSEFRALATRMKPDSIIKDPSFDLFEGTHSLEVDNTKLDSSLIQLSEDEQLFSCSTAYGESEEDKVAYVTAVADRLCRSIMVWLDEFQTLPTTVLSCRYVEHLLCQYTEDPSGDLRGCSLNTKHALFDQVLVSCVIGSCFFAKFVSTLFKAGVVFEEEDMNCNAMGLNLFSGVYLKVVKEHLNCSIALLETEYPNAKQLTLVVKLLVNLIQMHDYLPSNSDNSAVVDEQPLHNLIGYAQKLKNYELHDSSIYSGAFSPGIQKRLSNQFPPRDIVEPSGGEYDAFIDMSMDMLKVLSVNKAQSAIETAQFAIFFNRTRQRNVVARAFFPLYLMRDDQTVLGRQTFNDFSKQHMIETSLCGTALSRQLMEQPETSPLIEKFEEFMQEVSGIFFEWYQNTSQNRCRYRQGYNRQLLLWDSLQAQIETFEMELESEGVSDQIDASNAFMPLTTTIYLMKLRAMLDFVLRGFELEVYKPWEFFSMFWYAYYLAQHLENGLKRVLENIEKTMTSIQNMNKKLKKLKAGEKKDKLRATYQWRVKHEMPQLTENMKFMKFNLLEAMVLKILSLVQVFQFGLLKSYRLIDNKLPASNKFSSPEWIHKLRFKTFASIGVPELPSYRVFENSLQDFVITEPMFAAKLARSLDFTEAELGNAKTAAVAILDAIERGDGTEGLSLSTGTRLVKEQAHAHYSSLYNSIDALLENGRMLRTQLGDSPSKLPSGKFSIVVSRPHGTSPCFPLLSLNSTK